jgi:hypothetical protein
LEGPAPRISCVFTRVRHEVACLLPVPRQRAGVQWRLISTTPNAGTIPMPRIVLIVCIVVFLAIMLPFKYLFAPWLVDNYGLAGAAVFLGVCFLYAFWVDGRAKRNQIND